MSKHWERGTCSSAEDELLARTGSVRGAVGKKAIICSFCLSVK